MGAVFCAAEAELQPQEFVEGSRWGRLPRVLERGTCGECPSSSLRPREAKKESGVSACTQNSAASVATLGSTEAGGTKQCNTSNKFVYYRVIADAAQLVSNFGQNDTSEFVMERAASDTSQRRPFRPKRVPKREPIPSFG